MGVRRAAVLSAFLSLLALACASSPPLIRIVESGDLVEIRGPELVVKISMIDGGLVFREGDEEVRGAVPALYFSMNGNRVPLANLSRPERQGEDVVLQTSTAAGEVGLKISFPLDGVARLELTPPPGARTASCTRSADGTSASLYIASSLERSGRGKEGIGGCGAAVAAGLRLRSPPDEVIYGLTERISANAVSSEFLPAEIGSLNRRGLTIPMRVSNSVALYTPFFQTSRGYGIYVEGTSIGRYDLAATEREALDLEFEMPPGVASWAFEFIQGPTHDRILDRYTALSGRPFLPPVWAFKHWRWRDEHRAAAPATLDGIEMNADVVDDVTHYETLDIPVGNYTIDRPWATGDLPDLTLPEEPGFGDLGWDENRFPNPQKMIDALNGRGYHVFLWIGPWATGVNTNREARERGFLAPNSRFIIDYTNPDAVRWWSDRITPLIRMGFAGLKLDRGDEDIPDGVTDVYHDGRTGREVRNDYPVLFAKVHHDIMRAERGDDFLVYPRAGYAGSQRWAVFSAGDLPGKNILGAPTDLGLRAAILAVQYNAFNGFPVWGSDTGGYEQFGNREVFARWIEFSAFCPVMEIGGVGSHAPWDMITEPRYDTEMIDIYRFYVKLHHALVPYAYRHAQEAHRSGRPIAKPLVFNYREDARVRDLWEEFLFGDDILVAPVWKVGKRTQSVYLPKGKWVDFWERSRIVSGPVDLEEPAPLDRISIFVRAGAAVLDDLPKP